jgi:hypothetical protein
MLRHSWGTFVDPPSVVKGGKGVVVPGCETCKKRANTMSQYMEHLAEDVLPVILRAAFKIAAETCAFLRNVRTSVNSDNSLYAKPLLNTSDELGSSPWPRS